MKLIMTGKIVKYIIYMEKNKNSMNHKKNIGVNHDKQNQ